MSDSVTVALLSLRINYNVPDVAKLFSRFGPLAQARTATAPLHNYNRSLSAAARGEPGHYLQLATQVSTGPSGRPLKCKISWSSAIRSLGSAVSGNNGWLRYRSFSLVLAFELFLLRCRCYTTRGYFEYQRSAHSRAFSVSTGLFGNLVYLLSGFTTRYNTLSNILDISMGASRYGCVESNLPSEAVTVSPYLSEILGEGRMHEAHLLSPAGHRHRC